MVKSDIDGRFALVTGSSKGIGRAVALRLAEQGVNVAVNYNKSESEADKTVRAIETHGVTTFKVQADVSNPDDVTSMIDEVTETLRGDRHPRQQRGHHKRRTAGTHVKTTRGTASSAPIYPGPSTARGPYSGV